MTTNRSEEIRGRVRELTQRVAEAAVRAGRDPNGIQLMAVTKTVAPEDINCAVEAGITLLGENRVQEFLSKKEQYTLSAPNIHFIGHLQTNKVKYLMGEVSMIESVSSMRLAQEIHRLAEKQQRVMEILLEVNIGKEASKTGFFAEEIPEAVAQMAQMPWIRVRGLMCIPPKENADYFFSKTQHLLVDISSKTLDNISMNVLSMGMSNDFETAIQYGATIVRLGTVLFGTRPPWNTK